MNKQFLIPLLFLTLAVYGQQQERIAILNTVDDRDSIGFSDLNFLTTRFRETAINVLPKPRYAVMSVQSIVDFLGSEELAIKVCKETSCLAELGRKVSADYVAQARIGRFDKNLAIGVELYSSKNGTMVGSFTGNSENISGLLTIIDEKAPILFKKMPGVSDGSIASPIIAGGISGLEKAADYNLNYEKRYLAYLVTEPLGAVLSFNGMPSSSCPKTPCKVELREGNVRIIANLEAYEIADTTVLVSHNNQNIAITLKPNFGILEIKPAYIDDIGNDRQWNLSINDNFYPLGEVRLSPNKYSVKLAHECYENISFEAGINKGKREIFYMSNHIMPKKGGLVLSAVQNGEPVSEPVFVNGKRVGETPFSGTVPLCAKIEIGNNREIVDVKIKYKQTVNYTHRIAVNYTPKYDSYESYEQPYEPEPLQYETQMEPRQPAAIVILGIGMLAMMNSIDALYSSLGGGMFIIIESFKPNPHFLRFGLNLDGGALGASKMKRVIKQEHPEADSILSSSGYAKGGVFARLYPVDFLYISGGVNYGIYRGVEGISKATEEKVAEIPSIRTFVFPVGLGLLFGTNDNVIFDTQYNIALLKNRVGGYWSFNVGLKLGKH